MGAEQSLQAGRSGNHPSLADAIMTRALLEALAEASNEDSAEMKLMKEHAWDPGDCSPPFKVLRNGLTARRLPSVFTSDCIRGRKGYIGGKHVWEIEWENDERGSFAIVGVGTQKAPLQAVGYKPVVGFNTESWGWDIVNKKLLHGGVQGSYPSGLAAVLGFQVPDNFFMILDMDQRTLSFATKDIHLGVAFKQLPKQTDRALFTMANAIFGNCDITIKYRGSGESILSRLKHPFALHRSVSECPPEAEPEAASRRRSTGSPASPVVDGVVRASARYKFAYTRGESVAVMSAGKRAKRLSALDTFCNGIVMTAEPLIDDELFEVRLDSKVNRWMGGLFIGATAKDSNAFAFPASLGKCKEVFVWCASKIMYNMSLEQEVKENIFEITTGDRVGVMRKTDDTLHFFLNGKDIGKRFGKVPKTLYGVVDIFGKAEEVTITGGTAETQSSNDDKNEAGHDIVLIMVRMKSLIQLLRGPIYPDFRTIITKLYEDVAQPYTENTNQSIRQKLGDHLAEIGAAQVFEKLLRRLDDRGMETQEGWVGMSVVRSILWNYSDASLKIAKAIGECGLLKRFADDMRQARSINETHEKNKYVLDSAVNILHNCAKATENRQVFRDIKAVEVLVPFLKAENSEMVISTLLTLSYITEDNQKDLLKADSKTIGILRGMLSNAACNDDLRGRMESSSWSALEIITGIANVSVNKSSCEGFVDADVIPLLFDVMKKGGAIEKESTANALWVLANSQNGRKRIRDHPGATEILKKLSKDSNKNIAAAAERVQLRITQPIMQQGFGSSTGPRKNCEYKQNCREFLNKLGINDVFFEKAYDKCYCTPCHASRNEKLYYTQGVPAKDYVLPIGWCRFALKVTPQAIKHNASKKWHVAYHGTSPDTVEKILDCGQLLIPGDVAFGGTKLLEVDGHFCDNNKPDGFDTKQVFVSPSIRYSGLEVYAKTQSFEHPTTKKKYKAKVAFQLWIRPNSYEVGPQTVGAKDEIDPKFSNQEIEWSTAEKPAIHLYGLLIRLDE